MGCWNKTCGLSNLHIYAGTPVYVFVLEDATTRKDHCYTTSLFKPLLLPFTSEYNDYGGGENSSGVGFELIMNSIKSQLVEMPLGDNEYHDIAVTKEDFNEKLFFDAVHEDRLFVKTGYRDEQAMVTFTMFRKDIVDAILDQREIEEYVGDGKGTCGWGKNYVRFKFDDIAASVRPLLEQLSLDFSNLGDSRFYIVDAIDKYRSKYRAARWLSMGDNYRYSHLVNVRSLISSGIQRATPDALDRAEQLAIEYLKGVFIDSFMEDTRKTWIPGGHEGSQSADIDAHRLLANTVIAALDREHEEFLEETSEDEDELED